MEGFGMSVLQSAASGVPIVSSSLIPYATMYLKGVASIIPEQTPALYGDAMVTLLTESEAKRQKRKDAMKKCAADFSWSVRVNDLHTAEHEPTIIFAENQLDDYVIRLGEQANADLLVSAAHLHRGRFIEESISPPPAISAPPK
jgi:hypothetical protein